MNQVRIVGVGEFLPGQPVTNSQIEETFSLRAEWIDLMIGTKTRHFAVDLATKKVRFDLAGMCTHAGQAALRTAGMTIDQIDLIVMSTATPDRLMPATVNMVAEKLGADHVATFQIQSGCAGALQAVRVAQALLSDGAHCNALVVSGDTSARFLNLDRNYAKVKPSELVNIALFGDGAGAVVLSSERGRSGLVIEHLVNRFEGLGKSPGQLLNWAAPQRHSLASTDEQDAAEDYKAIEERVPQMARELLDELLSATGRSREDITHHLVPQLGGKMSQRIIKLLELDPTRCISRVDALGNAGNATPYFQLTELWERYRPGDSAVVVTIESSKWIKTGMVLRGE
jgi:3-oxoacyl-[acyl-carrier-protein] synthase-3